MEKTAKQIEKDVFRIMRDSELKNVIGGKFYRAGMRPKNAKTEDVVVKFLTGIDEQEQSGVVLVHVYVPNIQASNDGELVAVVSGGCRLRGTVELDLDHTRDGRGLHYGADSVGGVDARFLFGGQRRLGRVAFVLVAQATHQSPTTARDL